MSSYIHIRENTEIAVLQDRLFIDLKNIFISKSISIQCKKGDTVRYLPFFDSASQIRIKL